MNKFFLLALCLFSSVLLRAQLPASTASIYFETDQSELSAEARIALDELAPTLLQAPDYQVNIEAFTDDRGTATYNLKLAADRAASVQNYLAAKGLVASKTAVQNWGERKAAGPTEEGRQKSRRVDVVINAYFFTDFLALQDRLSANTAQTMQMDAAIEQTFTAAKGTLIIIPANAFVFEDGSAPTGPVELTVQEAYDPSDFILHNLTTTSEGRILQTGGMVKITAQSGGRELRLADGSALTVSIPNGGNFDSNMELFYAQPVANGGVDWKPAGQKFRKTLKPVRVELTIDPALGKRIAGIKVPEYPKPIYPSFKAKMQPEPQNPVAPYKPRAPKKPEWTSIQKLFAGGDASRLSRKELKKAQQYYDEQLLRFQRDSSKYVQLEARYKSNMAGYEQAKLRYTSEHQQWEKELEERMRAILLYQRELNLHLYAKNLAKTLKEKARTIRDYDTYSRLHWEVIAETERKNQLSMMASGFLPENQSSSRFGAALGQSSLFESLIGTKIIDSYKNINSVRRLAGHSLPLDSTSQITSRMLTATGIKYISDSLQAEIKEKTLLTTQNPDQLNYAMRGYVASVTQLGWINCDRFYNDPAEKMEVRVNETEDATLYVICKDINAMLPLSRNSNNTYAASGLPKGKKVTIVAIKIKDGMPQYAQREMLVGEPTQPAMSYKSMPLQELKAELRRLNI